MDVVPLQRARDALTVDALTHAFRRNLRASVVVVAHQVEQVVDLAGGWLFDHAIAGCDVSVLIARPVDPAPLRVLGASLIDLANVTPFSHDIVPQQLAIVGDERTFDEPVRRWIMRCLDTSHPGTTLWGDVHDPALLRCTKPLHHQPSLAALAFKARAHALATRRAGTATGNPDPRIESFRAVAETRPTTAVHGRSLITGE
ncbi:hypothetical protein [Nocardia kruczakiae]|uniref:hypothetical protein n=1 Tax=Nocardia kruczakiae TaxID=261477 RepID=UPI000B1B65EA|nr:hypothetical protein [Nocardia kruczakiae]